MVTPFIQPRSTYDQFILGFADNPCTMSTIVIYNKDSVIMHIINEIMSDGVCEDEAHTEAIEHFNYNFLPASNSILFCSLEQYLIYKQDHDE